MLLRWKPTLRSFPIDGLPTIQSGVLALAPSQDGSMWVGVAMPGHGKGLQRFVHDAWVPFVTPSFDSSSLEASTLFVDGDQSLWIGTLNAGIYRIHGDTVEHLDSRDGLTGDCVERFYQDREGTIWIATTKGLDSLRDTVVTTSSQREGLSSGLVGSVLASRDGTIWAGAANALNAIHPGGRVSIIGPAQGLPGTQVASLLEDHAGRLWVGVEDGLFVYENDKFRRISRADGSPTGMVVAITEDVQQNVWIEVLGPGKGLIRIHDMRIEEVLPVNEFPAARKLSADPHGGIWLGLKTGDIARYHDKKLEVIPLEKHPSVVVNQITANADGSVLGATGFGLIRFQDGSAHILNVRNGLPCDGLNGFVTDDSRNLWLSTQCGIVEIAEVELQRWWKNPESTITLRTFGTLDGALPGRADFNVAAKSPDGRLFFANNFELQMIDPAHLALNTIVPPVHIERVIADRKSYTPRSLLSFPPRTRDLQIDYTALSLAVPQEVRFRYQLQGYESDWQEAGTRRQAFYTNLRPGKYRFRVLACNNDDLWNDVGATIEFNIEPSWYQTSGFIAFSIVSGTLILWLLYRLRMHQLARALSSRIDERLAERNRLAGDLHDTLIQTIQGSKMLADNALADPSDALMRQVMQRLSIFLEQAIREGRAALNSLRISATQTDATEEALRCTIKELQLRRSLQSTLSVIGNTRPMHPAAREEVYKIAVEALRNAFLHSTGNRLEVKITYGRHFHLQVRDDGQGIDPDVAHNGKAGHFGMQGMRERAHRLHGELHITNVPTGGTLVELVVPSRIMFQSRGVLYRIFYKPIFHWTKRISGKPSSPGGPPH
jgi:signal transduction histidine kinase